MVTAEAAQASVTAFAIGQDARAREDVDGRTTAAAMGQNERLHPLPPVMLPVIVTEERTSTRQALMGWCGNRYSVPPELAATQVTVQQRLGATSIDIDHVSEPEDAK